MEWFAIENLIKFKVSGAKCTEIPVTLHRDGRKNSKSHLNTISDGWTTLRFLMVTCPKWLFFFPAITFFILSVLSFYNLSNLSNEKPNLLTIDKISSIIFYFLLGFQIFMFGLFSSLISIKLQMLKSKNINNFFNIFKIRYAFLISLFIISLMLIDNYFFDIFLVSDYMKKIIHYFGYFFSALLMINTLFVSLITLDEQK